MTGALVVGTAMGTGLLLLVTGLAPAPPPLGRALADLNRRRPSASEAQVASTHARLVRSVVGSALVSRLTEGLTTDLRVAGIGPAEHLAQRVIFAGVGLVWAPFTAALMWAAGVGVGPVLPLWVSLVLAPAGFLAPAFSLRTRAAERRRSFRHAFSSFLDVVSISLASGRGVDTALHDGARAGQGWPFQELRRALLEAQLMGETPWAGLERLGAELGIPEVSELAASAALAGAEGARVRGSLSAKARSLRLRGLTDIEAAAQAASARMSLPVVLLMFGFIIFIGFPAFAEVMGSI